MSEYGKNISKKIKLLDKIDKQYAEHATIPKEVLEMIASICWELLGIANKARGIDVAGK